MPPSPPVAHEFLLDELLERLRPGALACAHSPVEAFDVTLALAQADGPAELVLLTAAGRTGAGAFWRDVTIERVMRIGPGKDR